MGISKKDKNGNIIRDENGDPKRDYQAELAAEKEGGNKERQDDRVSRNAARREAILSGAAKKNDGTHVDHKNANPQDNSKGNTVVVAAKTNMKKYNKPA